MDVGEFLRELGLQQYEMAFRNNGVNDRMLPKLTAEDLKDLGITMVGHRRLLLKAIAALREPAASPGRRKRTMRRSAAPNYPRLLRPNVARSA